MELPLAGINVLGLEQAVAAPFATRQLRDLGARVIKLERPGGDLARRYDSAIAGEASYFVWLNRGKESVAVDLSSSDGKAVLARLTQWADVVVSNLAPATAERLSLRADDLRAAKPALVVVVISGYGMQGALAERKAYDALIQAELGLMGLTGVPEHPARVGISVADIAAGMYGLVAVLVGLLTVRRTGAGSASHVSLLAALSEWMQQPMLYALGTGTLPVPSGAHHATIAPYGPFATASGSVLHIAVQTQREWSDFCGQVLRRPELVGDDRLATNEARIANRNHLHSCIEAVFAGESADAIGSRLDDASIAWTRWGSAAQLPDHPQLAGMWRRAFVGDSAFPTLGLPIVGIETVGDGAIPRCGADTESVLRELDFPDAVVDELTRRWTAQEKT